MSSDQENSRLHMASSITSELLLGRNIDLGTRMASVVGAKPFRGASGHARLGLRHKLGKAVQFVTKARISAGTICETGIIGKLVTTKMSCTLTDLVPPVCHYGWHSVSMAERTAGLVWVSCV